MEVAMSHTHKEKQEPTHQAPTQVQPVEPEDASRAGDRYEQQKEQLQKNVVHGQTQRHPETPAGQHATGSFTGATGAGASGKEHGKQ
jgi:hypothetical protein